MKIIGPGLPKYLLKSRKKKRDKSKQIKNCFFKNKLMSLNKK